MMELALNRGQIREYIRMIKLKVIEYRDMRAVMNELGPLIEEGRVVLVSFDYKRCPRIA